MKFVLGVITALVAAGLLYGQSRLTGTQSPSGTFQLVPADYVITGFPNGRAVSETTRGMFRINTATGETWSYNVLFDGKNIMHEGWHKIEE